MKSRREFIQLSALGAVAGLTSGVLKATPAVRKNRVNANGPVAISTWKHGIPANEAAWKVLENGGRALDAVETGVRTAEDDPDVMSVGYGGYPDRDGNVTLDASIMDEKQQCGSVAFLQHIKNPVSVARLVMEKTPHIMLVGDGALEFALQHGFRKQNLLTEKTLKKWEEMSKTQAIQSFINIENHDTIGMLVMDGQGDLSGACTTSGTAFKVYGRVGDSPIIGAGLFVDNEVGAATATGWGEEVMRNAGSAVVVELMRQGRSPQEACEELVKRIASRSEKSKKVQVGFIAINQEGETGAFSIQPGFQYALMRNGENKLYDAPSLF